MSRNGNRCCFSVSWYFVAFYFLWRNTRQVWKLKSPNYQRLTAFSSTEKTKLFFPEVMPLTIELSGKFIFHLFLPLNDGGSHLLAYEMYFGAQSILVCTVLISARFATYFFKTMFLQSLMPLSCMWFESLTPTLFFICLIYRHILLWHNSTNF